MSIGRKLTIYVLILSAIFALLETAFQLYRDYQSGLARLESTFLQIEHSQLRSLASSAWTLDQQNIELQLAEIGQLWGVAYLGLIVEGADSTVYGEQPGQELWQEKAFPIRYQFGPDMPEVEVGTLVVALTLKPLYRELRNTLLWILTSKIVEVLILAICIISLFHLFVTRHLVKISQNLSSTTLDSLDQPVHLKPAEEAERIDQGKKDELSILVSAINQMRSDLSRQIKEKEQTEAQLRSEVIDRRTAEAAAQSSEGQLRTLIETLPDIVWLKDLDGTYLVCNPRFEQLVGLPQQEILGKRVDLLFDAERASVARQRDREVIEQRAPQILEEEVVYTQDGHREWMETVRTPVFSAEGEVVGILGIGRDISERRSAEQALRRAQKMDAIGQLTGGIAHDFNNILGIILGHATLLRANVISDPSALKRVDSIHKSAKRAATLTRQLLGFARRQAHEVQVTDINQLIEEMDTLIERSVTPEVTVVRNLAALPLLVEIDPGDFEDALLNLVLNARDAMPQGGRLTIETSEVSLDEVEARRIPEAKPGDYALVRVADTGQGIPAHDIEHIFEPFFSTKPQGKGTGLGLSMVFGFVTRSKGCLQVTSEEGVGTALEIYLPRADRFVIDAPSSEATEELLPVGEETVLLVDDEKEIVGLAKESLQSLGYRVLTAYNGADALECLRQHPEVDLLFSDVVMPGEIGGFRLAEEAVKEHPGLKVLLTSGYTGGRIGVEGEHRFATSILQKPYNQAELANRVRTILEGKEN